jgi:hypothetical protein
MVVSVGIDSPAGSAAGAQSADIALDVQLLDVNEDQDIEAPENAQPLDDLLDDLGGLGALGGLGGGGGSGAGGGGGSGGGGAGQDSLEEYSRCIQEAGDDTDAARACADLLTP